MKKTKYAIVIITFILGCVWFMTEITLGTIFFFMGVYVILALLILHEKRKAEEQMGRIFKKLGKNKENIMNLLENY